ncbi:aminoacyl-tRNA hydrolase [Nitrosophilus alvini]|uniref:aminoacyl-tRNA hydrolase n=1 Tax=Nitrosophilus alvini TaxID=2714855 RepID=UPI00190D7A3F|nr:aminoacyl-tRNA hydrolase [Nitrosophilus alvini]
MFLIVGLGNPGPKYEKNRHNIGFMVIDYLVSHYKATPINKSSFKGELYKTDSTLLLKPMTFMNLSGQSVSAVKNFYKIENSNIIVCHDDIDLPFGAIRIKVGGSSGGHNGLKSLDSFIGNDYIRVRIGVGRPKEKAKVVSYVLSDFDLAQSEHLEEIIKNAAEAAVALTKKSLDEVRSKYTKKGAITG